MRCPACYAALIPSRYEGLPVFFCEGCSGYLVGAQRVGGIERRRDKSKADLIADAAAAGDSDSDGPLKCPRCRREMDKETWPEDPSFHLDKCTDCGLVWFDTGELAKLQLGYEFSDRGMDAERFQDRLRQMTPEEQAEFERNLASLPEGDASLASAFGQGLRESVGNLVRGIWRNRD